MQKDSEDLFNFSNYKQNHPLDKVDEKNKTDIDIKIEKSSPTTNNFVSSKKDDNPVNSLFSNGSSVFAIPNETDEIIFLDDTENIMFDTPDISLNNSNDKSINNDIGNIGTLNGDNFVMERFECPECASVCKNYSIYINKNNMFKL